MEGKSEVDGPLDVVEIGLLGLQCPLRGCLLQQAAIFGWVIRQLWKVRIAEERTQIWHLQVFFGVVLG